MRKRLFKKQTPEKVPGYGLILRYVKEGKPAGQSVMRLSISPIPAAEGFFHLLVCEECQQLCRENNVHHIYLGHGNDFLWAWRIGDEEIIEDEAVYAAMLNQLGV